MTSSNYAEAYNVRLADMPASVRAEAVRVVALPDGPLKKWEVKNLIVKLRRSELRKASALKSAVRYADRARAHLAKRGGT